MSETVAVHETRWTFPDPTARDEWISRRFPERIGTEAPGVYEVPDGTLVVFMETVTLWVPCGLSARACELREVAGW